MEIPRIQWFPGHMTKTLRIIEKELPLIDAIVEILDARIPRSSCNPELEALISKKPRIILLNKCDYADDNVTALWKEYFLKQDINSLICDCRSGKNIKNFVPLLKKELSPLLEKRSLKGMLGKPLSVMITGIPNVGKSSFINRMANSKRTKVEDRPGVTRGKQWINVDKDINLLDMPGVLWRKFENDEIALNLAFTGAIKDDVIDIDMLAMALAEVLANKYPHLLKSKYGIDNDNGNIIENIAKNRGMLISGGELDISRACITLLDDFRGGRIGKISLEKPF